MKKITSLTPEQQARFPEFIDKWTKIGLSTEPADRPRAEAAIKGLYKLANLSEPKIVWYPCPMTGVKAALELAKKAAKEQKVRDPKSFIKLVGQSFFGGSLWAGYSAWADYFNIVCGIEIDKSLLEVNQSCGFFWTLDGICLATERPSKINLDENGQLHSETEMSISYAGSGWGLYHWHGTQIPGEWITDKKSLTPTVALKQENMELRRVACEILGWGAIMKKLKHKTIDKDDDPTIGELIEVQLPDLDRPAKFLRVQCGTGREFVQGVPMDIMTAIDAQAWLVGLSPKDFKLPEVRS